MLNLTYNDALSAYSNYPAPIRPYLLRAETHPVLRAQLTKSFMRAFIDLLSRANIANPARPIQVRMDLTARRLGISAKTVSRTIGLMMQNAWLKPNDAHDGRNWQGKYAGREFLICDELRKLVGLPCHNQVVDVSVGAPAANNASDLAAGSNAASASSGIFPPGDSPATKVSAEVKAEPQTNASAPLSQTAVEETELSDGSVTYPQQQAEKTGDQTKMSAGHIVNKDFELKEASFQKEAIGVKSESGKTAKIPTDLVELNTRLGISGWGICALMRLAKEKRQRLQDVWKAKRDQLLSSGATGGRAVRYLQYLLTCGEDFGFIARTRFSNASTVSQPANTASAAAGVKHQSASGQERSQSSSMGPGQDQHLLEIGRNCAFKKFRHVRNGLFVRFYDGTADVSRGADRAVYAGWEMMKNLYLGIARGNLVEVVE